MLVLTSFGRISPSKMSFQDSTWIRWFFRWMPIICMHRRTRFWNSRWNSTKFSHTRARFRIFFMDWKKICRNVNPVWSCPSKNVDISIHPDIVWAKFAHFSSSKRTRLCYSWWIQLGFFGNSLYLILLYHRGEISICRCWHSIIWDHRGARCWRVWWDWIILDHWGAEFSEMRKLIKGWEVGDCRTVVYPHKSPQRSLKVVLAV